MALPLAPLFGSGSLLSISTSVLHPLSSSVSAADCTFLVLGILSFRPPETSPACRQ